MEKYGIALNGFLNQAVLDPRIGATHISLYVALLRLWEEGDFAAPIMVDRDRVMQFAKISSPRTYFQSIRSLDQFGYITYYPASHRYMKSSVQIIFNFQS